MKKICFAAMNETRVLYTVCVYRNHVFRQYPDGRIEKASEQEEEIVLSRNQVESTQSVQDSNLHTDDGKLYAA